MNKRKKRKIRKTIKKRKNVSNRVLTVKNTSKPTKPTKFLFGYGSLINHKSLLHTGKNNTGKSIPVVLKKQAGFRREWVCFPHSRHGKFSFLGLKKNKSKSHSIYGVLAPIYRNIKDFDKRENGYKRVRIDHDPKKKCVFKALCGHKLPNYKCTIYFYVVGANALKPRKSCPITQNYLDVVVLGSLKYGLHFTKKVIKNIKGWRGQDKKVHWVDDRLLRKKRQYMKNVSCAKLKKLDTIIKSVIPGFYKLRV